uniref:Uncharacterized protein n=1 Tax=Arundo donax TaxID=35708 RepID=A0A0A9GNH1_ARUDO
MACLTLLEKGTLCRIMKRSETIELYQQFVDIILHRFLITKS